MCQLTHKVKYQETEFQVQAQVMYLIGKIERVKI